MNLATALISAASAFLAMVFAFLAWFAPRGTGPAIAWSTGRDGAKVVLTNTGWRQATKVVVVLDDGRRIDLRRIDPGCAGTFTALGNVNGRECGFEVSWARWPWPRARRDFRA